MEDPLVGIELFRIEDEFLLFPRVVEAVSASDIIPGSSSYKVELKKKEEFN